MRLYTKRETGRYDDDSIDLNFQIMKRQKYGNIADIQKKTATLSRNSLPIHKIQYII